MRGLIAEHGTWVLSAFTLYVTLLQGNKARHAWLMGLASQGLWFVWIVCAAKWGLLPLTAMLVLLYVRNHRKWRDGSAGDAEIELRRGWVVADASGTKFRAWEWGPMWTYSPSDALMFARRRDAEDFCQDDEDAWRIMQMDYTLTAAEMEHRRGVRVETIWPRA